MADLQMANEAIDELTTLRQRYARKHSEEIVQLMREKATLVLENDSLKQEVHDCDTVIKEGIARKTAAIQKGADERRRLQAKLDSMKERRDTWEKEANRLKGYLQSERKTAEKREKTLVEAVLKLEGNRDKV